MITDTEIDKALDYLRDSARHAAQARHDVVVTEQWIKTEKARLMSGHQGSVAAAEVSALSHPDFKAAVQAHGAAVERWEAFRMLREAALAKIEAWRTFSSNERAARP